MDWSRSQIKLFRTLLYAYPSEFRREYGSEMEQLFADRLASESWPAVWAQALADVAITAPREHVATLFMDARHALRIFAANPAFTGVTIFVMAVGMAACVSVFSLANAVLLRALPYQEPEKLVYLWSPNHNFKGVPDEIGPNLPDFTQWQQRSHSFSHMAAFNHQNLNLVRNGSSTRIGAAAITPDFFATLGVPAQMGRVLTAEDDKPGRSQSVVISDALWKRIYASSPSVLGERVQLNRKMYIVVGVMPPGFGFPFDGDVPYERYSFRQTDLWLPAAFSPEQKLDRTEAGLGIDAAIARVRPNVSLMQAQDDLKPIQAGLQPLYAPRWRGFSVLVRSMTLTIIGPVQQMFWTLLAAVTLVLLVAIANTANLLLARTSARAHELGIRSALGAERSRITRQLLTESLLLSVAGGIFGIAFSYAVVHLLVKVKPNGIPRLETAAVDPTVMLFAFLLAIATGTIAGLFPALAATRANVHVLLRDNGRTTKGGFARSRAILITSEVALSVVLLASSGLLIRSYLKLAAADPGFSPATLTFDIDLDERYNSPEQQAHFFQEALRKFGAIPGVISIGESNALPLTGHESVTAIEIEGHSRDREMIQQRAVTSEYLQALGVPILRGRGFSPHDLNTPVALVNQRFAETYFGNRNPTGSHIRFGMPDDLSHGPWSTVVGVVANLAHDSLEDRNQPQVFTPATEGTNFAIATRVPTDQLQSKLERTLRTLDPVLTLGDVRTMQQRMDTSNARRIFQTSLLGGFSLIAVGLALAGLYGLLSYLVRERTSEIGVRMALGASRTSVAALFLNEGIRLTAIGNFIGIAGALCVTRLLSAWLFGISAFDPITFVLVPACMLAIACLSCISPAWSAAHTDPVQALRRE